MRCWKSHALMMLVATLGKIPRFFCLFLSLSGSSSSPVPGDATLLSKPSPGRKPNPGLNNIPDQITDLDFNSLILKQNQKKRKLQLKYRQSKMCLRLMKDGSTEQMPQMPRKDFQKRCGEAVRIAG